MNKPHLPTLEEVEKNWLVPTAYVYMELSPDTVRERIKKHLKMSQLEKETRIFDTYFVKKE